MAGMSSGGGQYEVNGQPVNAQEYKLFEKFWNQLHRSSEMTPAQVNKLEQELQSSFFTPPHRLRGLVWEFISFESKKFSPEFQQTALLEALTATPGGRLTAFSAMQALETLPLESWTPLSARLTERLPDLPDETYAVVDEVLRRMENRKSLLAQATAGGVASWLAVWLELIRNGAYSRHGATPSLLALPQGKERLELLERLLNLNPAEYQPPASASEYERAVFPSQWWRGRTHALMQVLREKLTPAEETLLRQELVEKATTPLDRLGLNYEEFDRAVYPLVKKAHDEQQVSPLMLAALRRSQLQAYRPSPDLKWVNDIQTPELNPGEAWSDAFLSKLDALPDSERALWPALVAFARSASAGKPTAKWLKEAQKHIEAVGEKHFREVLTASLPLLSKPRTFPLNDVQYGPDPNLVLDNFNSLSLKGLLWMVPLATDSALTRLLSGVVESALKKVPGVGPREPKVANAAVYALGQIDSELALSALARLSTTVTFKGTLKEVQKALNVVSERLKVTPDELLDMGTPTLGLQRVGERVETLGEAEARLTVNAGGVQLSFSKGGKPLKSVPAVVKKDFAEELKELKTAQKEAEKTVSALSQRLDGLMIQPREWKGESWLDRYLNHALAGTVARRLIWLVDGVPAFFADGEMRDVNGQVVPVSADSIVKLWHPIGRSVEEVLAWRHRLETLEIRQPFKQAWREVYVLTDAERRTNTYSNRFAGHVLKQHQFNQLAALRGWRNKLRLMVDDSYPPAMRDLPAYGLRAEYWIEGIGENYGEDTTESGSFLRVTTDQVRFYPMNAPENHAHAGGGGYTMWVNQTHQPVNPIPMEEVPPLVLSEILRDVDLFVGVASVGNDPTWQDGGPGGRFREYWQSYSFGELNETAKTRAEYLKRLIPRLKIKDRLNIDGKFLRVRGDVKTYKIHLGSSNILMEPNDQYLCIIPGGKSDGLEVDFDGDRVLSLVLSKAFLLVDDTKITDPVILQQLKR